eukprot:12893228-Prorocentrum_lima.AAC.1
MGTPRTSTHTCCLAQAAAHPWELARAVCQRELLDKCGRIAQYIFGREGRCRRPRAGRIATW